MAKPKPREYADALDDLERMRAAGSITQGQYEVHRQRLMAEMTQKPLPIGVRLVIFLVGILALLLLLRFVVGPLLSSMLGA